MGNCISLLRDTKRNNKLTESVKPIVQSVKPITESAMTISSSSDNDCYANKHFGPFYPESCKKSYVTSEVTASEITVSELSEVSDSYITSHVFLEYKRKK